jgi:hypothetical protein
VTDEVIANEVCFPRIFHKIFAVCFSFFFILQLGLGGVLIMQAAIVFALVTMGDDEQSGDDEGEFRVVRHQHVTPLGTWCTCIAVPACSLPLPMRARVLAIA